MIYKFEEFPDWGTTKISIYLNEGTHVATDEYCITGLQVPDKREERAKILKEMLSKVGYVHENDLDAVAREFNSTADVVLDNLYKIDDLLNSTWQEWREGKAKRIYFKKIEGEHFYKEISCADADKMIEESIHNRD